MAIQEPTQSRASGSQEKMGRSKRSNWFIRYCCCCCGCCCREDDVNRPLLHSTTPKEQTPVPAPVETKEDGESVSGSGEETQQVQLVVADIEETLDSEIEQDTEAEKVAKDKEQEKPVEIDLEPTERARVSSGTFVRGSSQRASWRLVPSFTQQVKEAREASETEKDAAPTNQGGNNDSEQVEGVQIEQGIEKISFKSDENPNLTTSDRNVTLVAQDIYDDDTTLQEPVTMTFTIGCRGNQEAASSSTLEKSTLINDEQQLQGQRDEVEDVTSSAVVQGEEKSTDQANEEDTILNSIMDMDQPTTPILTEQH